jgi:hypothetical protein
MSAQPVAQISFDFYSRLPVIVEAQDVQVSSDAGILPLRQFDDQLGLTERFIACLNDPRDPALVDHSLGEMVRQRLYGILAGYEDCNDHDTLRRDPVFKLVSGQAPNDPRELASQPTLSRFENGVDVAALLRLQDFFLDEFVRSFERPPQRLTLDFDAVDDPCHGQQQLALFHGFYDQYQYLPLVISCAETKQVLRVALRHGTAHAALGAEDDLREIVTHLRQAWPDVHLHIRGDAGFAGPRLYELCEQLEVDYSFGLPSNAVLHRASDDLLRQAVQQYEQTGQPQRLFTQRLYRAQSWKKARRVIVKAECHRPGTNRRYVVTNRPGAAVLPAAAYDEYVERGESENRNKELKCDLAADRLSCHRFLANYFRLYLHAAALNLLVQLRAVVAEPPALRAWDEPDAERVPVADPELPVAALAGAERRRYHNFRQGFDPLGQGHLPTWHRLLIKVAGQVFQSARRILVRVPAQWPHLHHFVRVCERIRAWRAPHPVPL